MSLPSTNSNGQSSIRNFFQPKSPTYAPPPALSRTQATSNPAPPPPPPAAARPPPITGQNGPNSPSPASFTNAPPTRPSSLHPQATIAPILPEYIPALRRITSLLLPISYPDSFYQRLSDPVSSAFSRVLLWTDPNESNGAPKVIGGLVCRPEPSPFTSSSAAYKPNTLYIQSLVLLSPYRSLGLAAALLDEIAQLSANSTFACEEVYAHVWTENEDGLRWYLARGFRKHGEIQGYYFKLRPGSAWIVRRQITTSTTNPTHSINSALAPIPPSTTTAAANLPALAPQPGPPRSTGPSPNRSATSTPGVSYQNARPQTEWNDLPADMHTPPPGANGIAPPGSSAASSRSSSAAPRKKRDRAYPAAAFGK